MAFSACVVVTNFKIFLLSSSFSPLSVGIVIGSILVYLLTFWFFSCFYFLEMYGYFQFLIRIPSTWFGLLCIVGVTTFFDIALTRWEYFENNEISASGRPKNYSMAKLTSFILGEQIIRNTRKHYTGFAFAAEEPLTKSDLQNYTN
eukprot:TRINITY_DN10342_c0_g1_i4.p1 TRINITY_DN10342_c0_g1~~TRINITY_DN10342_c0_g1_i4.p1  ORF type:complete len:146 (-),score=17.41 TRINITY_DN10342_c0_g1_i4:92-529(-)